MLPAASSVRACPCVKRVCCLGVRAQKRGKVHWSNEYLYHVIGIVGPRRFERRCLVCWSVCYHSLPITSFLILLALWDQIRLAVTFGNQPRFSSFSPKPTTENLKPQRATGAHVEGRRGLGSLECGLGLLPCSKHCPPATQILEQLSRRRTKRSAGVGITATCIETRQYNITT